MSQRLETRSEIIKLARLFEAEPSEVGFLESLPAHAVRGFREGVTARLFDADAGRFGRLSAAANMLPGSVVATVAQHAFGPLLCARAAGFLDEGKALDVLGRLPAEFLAEAAANVDPRHTAALIAGIPDARVAEVAELLAARRDYVTMGRFLGYLGDEAIEGSVGALTDEALLRTAFVLEHKDRLDTAIDLMPPGRLAEVSACASQLNLWPEALDLVEHLSDQHRAAIAEHVAELGPDAIGSLVEAVSAAEIWDSLLPTVRFMSEESLVRLLSAPAFSQPRVLEEIITATVASDADLWRDVGPILLLLPAEAQTTALDIISELGPDRLERVLRASATAPQSLPALLMIGERLPPTGEQALATAMEQVPDDIVRTLVQELGESGLNRLPPAAREAALAARA